jgi:hypothetical protein
MRAGRANSNKFNNRLQFVHQHCCLALGSLHWTNLTSAENTHISQVAPKSKKRHRTLNSCPNRWHPRWASHSFRRGRPSRRSCTGPSTRGTDLWLPCQDPAPPLFIRNTPLRRAILAGARYFRHGGRRLDGPIRTFVFPMILVTYGPIELQVIRMSWLLCLAQKLRTEAAGLRKSKKSRRAFQLGTTSTG